jgi:hypothetical protein
MTTLDNINENILNKIDLITKINDILFFKFNIDTFLIKYRIKDINNLNINIKLEKEKIETLNLDIYFIKNCYLLIKKYINFIKTKNIYETQSILFLTEYYAIINKKDECFANEFNNKIYNDNIFLLNIHNNNYLLESEDLLNLKNIYYQNYYQYKFFKIPVKNKKYDNNNNNKLSKNIYHKFNMFISGEDIYGILDNYLEYIYNFLILYKDIILDYNQQLNDKFDINVYEKLYKKIYQCINIYNKSKLVYNIDEINYDICTCGNKMIIQANTSELLCIKCGEIHTLIGSVFEDSQFYNQEGNRYKHGSYDPNRHCKFWIDRIQAKENTIIEDSILEKIKNCIKKDKIENIKNISIDQFRLYLKQTNLSKLNDHIPLIKKLITGYIPPQLTHNELHILFNYFDKATKTYEIIKPKEKSNSLYYPFLIYKILDLIIEDKNKKRELLSCIHLQSYETLIDNDKIWFQICKQNSTFVYKPTDKSNIY